MYMEDRDGKQIRVVGIPDDIYWRFKRLIDSESIGVSDKLIDLITEYVEKNKPKVLK